MTINDVVVSVKESLRSEVLWVSPEFRIHVSAVAVRYDLNKKNCFMGLN